MKDVGGTDRARALPISKDVLMPTFLSTRLPRLAWDAASWVIAAGMVTGVANWHLSAHQWVVVGSYVLAACVLQVLVGLALKLYLGRYRFATFDENVGLAVATGLVGLALAIFSLSVHGLESVAVAVSVLCPPLALLSMVLGRGAYRARHDRERPPAPSCERVVVYGAGDAGSQLVRLIAEDRSVGYHVVGLVDDDRLKRHLVIHGCRVIGTGTQLVERAREAGATIVILAIPSAGAELVRRVSDEVSAAGLKFLTLPPLREMIARPVQLGDVRDLDIADLLGRRQVDTDVERIADHLAGRRVLITGAGGSIGSELARQVHLFGPASLIMLDRDESGLHGVQLSIYGHALLDTPDVVLCDIRDEEALRTVFATHRPEVVFHAAALKHLPMLEQYPDEGWKTNVLGTRNVLRLAAEFGVERFVNISTDKAADAKSVLGMTKRLAERLTAWFAEHHEGTFVSVRFGNVLGSRGSVLHTFREQIARGGPVTVTDPAVTRYFMTIPEACELVIQAAAIGHDGEVLVLDMGEPVRIVDVARRMIAQSGRDVKIVFTGMRPGEKLHEDLFSPVEHHSRSEHPAIEVVDVPSIDPAHLSTARGDLSLLRLAPEPAEERHAEVPLSA
ncbi:nucleoside-diphosphate sugar epimerase/dehydratase [Georgenia daeguensis]|uniref:Nucleoside-diphosphate sugar epimerase/dehydratase n=2 Tax=Georgenia daeguensis TaxID=908355 RepID=A0ABP8ESL6_9MICO